MTCNGALEILWENKFFLKERTVNDIKKELNSNGYNFDDAALMMALKRSKFLTRRGTYGNYSYIQKYPYSNQLKK
jgi:hypothetical protein